MPCFRPLTAYRTRERDEKGKFGIVFNPVKGYADIRQQVPCGQCIGCRLERSRQWAIRCVHEASLHDENCFITLTYDDKHLPRDGSLHVEDFQKFMKRVRKKHEDKKIRFFHCGEYGDAMGRPHFHAIIFGLDFRDRKGYTIRKGSVLSSDELAQLWPNGFNAVGDVTFESAAYVARYITKKVTGDRAEKHYERIDYKTGEVINLRPEYTTMSRRPGIAHGWIEKYHPEVYPCDEVIMRGRQMKPPRYYDAQMEKFEEEEEKFWNIPGARREMPEVKERRLRLSQKVLDNNKEERLSVREALAYERQKQKERAYENESKSVRNLR